MLRLKWLLCGLSFGFVASAVSCGGTASDRCDATTCADGCCDAYGQCITPTSAFRCGLHGEVCSQCAPTQACDVGLCVEGATGGGDGATGGGDGAMGGGSATSGGGSATTGGGSGATDGGAPTCLAGAYQPTPTRTNASSTMAPGYACISCHSGANFNGQNPNGLSAPRDLYQFMGTVF